MGHFPAVLCSGRHRPGAHRRAGSALSRDVGHDATLHRCLVGSHRTQTTDRRWYVGASDWHCDYRCHYELYTLRVGVAPARPRDGDGVSDTARNDRRRRAPWLARLRGGRVSTMARPGLRDWRAARRHGRGRFRACRRDVARSGHYVWLWDHRRVANARDARAVCAPCELTLPRRMLPPKRLRVVLPPKRLRVVLPPKRLRVELRLRPGSSYSAAARAVRWPPSVTSCAS